MSNIFERRSVNYFDPARNVDENLLKDIINLAVKGPSAFNLQPWEIIAVRTEEAKEKLFNLANQQQKIKDAPVTLVLIGDRSAYKDGNPHWAFMKKTFGEDATKGAMDAAAYLYGTTEERKIKFAESNTGLLAMSIMYAAKHFGVDSHAMSGIDFEGIKDAFSLDDEQDVVMLIGLGFFDESKSLYPAAPRKEFDTVVRTV